MSRTAAALAAVAAQMGAPPAFNPLEEFLTELKKEFGGISRDKIEQVKQVISWFGCRHKFPNTLHPKSLMLSKSINNKYFGTAQVAPNSKIAYNNP
jgi:hypothetical protein